jgi:hypothetical protein
MYRTVDKFTKGGVLQMEEQNSFEYEQSDIIKALFGKDIQFMEENAGFYNRMENANNLFNKMRKSLFNKV